MNESHTPAAGGSTVTRLVLLTHNSNVFLQYELDALADAYDEVHLLGWGATGPDLTLKPNVRVLGFFEVEQSVSKADQVRMALSPRFLIPFLRVARQELRGGRLFRHFWMFWWFCIQGARIADIPGLRESIGAADRIVTVYGFWAVGASHALPWLPRPSGGRVLRLHSADIYEWLRGYLPMRRWLFSHADLLLFASRHGRDYVLNRYPDLGLDRRSHVSFLGSDDHGVGPRPDGEIPVLVTCSSFTPEKRLAKLAQALSRRRERLRWIHFGAGPLESDVRRVIAESPQIEIDFRGQTDHDEIMDFYARHPVDVFVNVSDREAVAISICEALSFGIPVVATDVGGSGDVVGAHLGSGLLVSADVDDDALLAAIDRVIAARREGFDPRAVWHRLCDARRNAATAASMISAVDGPRA